MVTTRSAVLGNKPPPSTPRLKPLPQPKTYPPPPPPPPPSAPTRPKQTPAETGQIYDAIQRAAMKTVVEEERLRRANVHKQHETWRKYVEHRYAQASYEDFLYYQNVWNRRNYVPSKVYTEGKKGATIRRAFKQAMRPKDVEAESDGDVVAKGKGKAPPPKGNKTYGYGMSRDPIIGTTNQNKMDMMSTNWYHEPFFGLYYTWLDHLIALYTDARLGYRKRIPDVIAPEDAHRYTQPPRGTVPQTPLHNANRHWHLEERFPRRTRVQIDVGEVEEVYRSKAERRGDVRLERTGEMKGISWRIDEGVYEKIKSEEEAKSGFSTNPRTLGLLPKEHKTHHGSRETSFYWPTSFDDPAWGGGVAVTAVKREYAFEEVSDKEGDLGKLKKRKTDVCYKLDENGERIKKIDNRPRFKRVGYTQEGRVFQHDMSADGTHVAGRDRNDRWTGSFVDGNIFKDRWELDEDESRIPLPPRYVSQTKYATAIVQFSNVRNTRPGRHTSKGITDQLSDDEDEGCVDSNENFAWSGNMNPDSLGDPWASSDKRGDEEGADRPGDGDEDESDGDGDVFAESYRACSKCPKRERARTLLEDLQARYGDVQGMGIQQIMDMQQHEDGFQNITDDEIREEYVLVAEDMSGQ
ncbi:hypothetical protein G6011_11743 [Alternaria panax]|uniref:Uncharacterized protein n=1 Tax=Alternaria panax TaxID=48097 RepID=A0AAD4F7S0_9PLEO|nr:hypothetical protein G6011_11743 [Alternaria panax]